MAEWRLESWTRSGSRNAILPFRNLQGEFWRNKPKQVRFELPLYHPLVTRANVDPGKSEIKLVRDNTVVYTGVLWNATAGSSDRKLTCDSESLESYLWQRVLTQDLRYSAVAGGVVMWDLINRAQTGTDANLFITQGTIQAAPTRTISFLKNDLLVFGDIVTDFANDADTGFDWEIDQNRQLQVYSPRPATASRSKLLWGGAIVSYSVQVQGKYEANSIWVAGHEAVRSSNLLDTAKRAEYGLRDFTDTNDSMRTIAAANDYAQRLLDLRRDVRETPQLVIKPGTVNPFDGDIWPGQTAPVVISDGWTQFNETMRCDGFQFTVGKHGTETIVLYMNDLREV